MVHCTWPDLVTVSPMARLRSTTNLVNFAAIDLSPFDSRRASDSVASQLTESKSKSVLSRLLSRELSSTGRGPLSD